MKVVFIKDHLSHKIGDVEELTETEANYLIRVKVVERYRGKEIVKEKEKHEVKHAPKKQYKK